MIDTKERILDTAEQLFGEQGYSATSLRQVIGKAEVNLAAVHYHFGSKEDLLDALVLRKAEPVNRKRLELLDHLEAQANGKPLPVQAIMEAFFLPTAETAAANPQFARVMGRIHSEGLMPTIVQKHFNPTAKRFLAALRRSLPQLNEAEFLWRVHFMTGAMAHTMCGIPSFPLPPEDFHGRMRKLVTFLTAGFLAPASATEGK
jgi:AcrR family transcriptional regulator